MDRLMSGGRGLGLRGSSPSVQPGRPGLPWLAVAAFTVLAVVVVSGGARGSSWAVAPTSWSNGQVLCEFAPALPSVAVSALSRADSGLLASVVQVSEVGPTGLSVATANLSTAAWTATNRSTEDAYNLSYAASAPIEGTGSPPQSLGVVEVRADFVLPIYAESGTGPTDTVSMNILVGSWSWQSAGDHMSLGLAAAPAYPFTEKLVPGLANGLVSSVSIASGDVLEQMNAASVAEADPGTANAANISATPSVSGNGSAATVAITFGSAAGAFGALAYVATVHVLLPSNVAGIPTVDLVAVGGVGAAVAILVATGTWRIRRRPSDLTYADEDEP